MLVVEPVLDRNRGQVHHLKDMMIPISFVLAATSLALAFRLLRLRSGTVRSRWLWQGFFLLTAAEALLVGLRFGYGVSALAALQAMLPLFFGPLLYLGFAVMIDDQRRIWPHLIAAAGLALLPQVIGSLQGMIDFLIMASYGFYLNRLLALWRAGPDQLLLAPAETAADWVFWQRGAALLLGFVLAIDLVVALDFAFADGRNASWLIALGTLPIWGAFLWFGMSMNPKGQVFQSPCRPTSGDDLVLTHRLEKLFLEASIHRDPDLSISRLARRLGVPVHDLSRAINRTYAMNVSQWVNKQRIEEAARKLVETDQSLVEIHQSCGFLSRSNFYREFQRVYGQAPGEFRKNKK